LFAVLEVALKSTVEIKIHFLILPCGNSLHSFYFDARRQEITAETNRPNLGEAHGISKRFFNYETVEIAVCRRREFGYIQG
jgi:hypothetical protein